MKLLQQNIQGEPIKKVYARKLFIKLTMEDILPGRLWVLPHRLSEYKTAGSLKKHEDECKDKFHCRYCSKGLASPDQCSRHEKPAQSSKKKEEETFEVDLDLSHGFEHNI